MYKVTGGIVILGLAAIGLVQVTKKIFEWHDIADEYARQQKAK